MSTGPENEAQLPSPQLHEHTTRREFLKRASLVGGGALLGQLAPDIIRPTEQSERAIYGDGDTIETPAGDFKIDGWKIVLPSEQNLDGNRAYSAYILGGRPGAFSAGRDILSAHTISIVDNKVSEPYAEFIPPFLSDPMALIVVSNGTQSSARNIAGAYLVEPTMYSEYGMQWGTVLSEASIDPKELEKVAALRDAFEKFVLGLAPIYVKKSPALKEEKEQVSGGFQSPTDRIIEMADKAFTDPLYEGEALGTAFHEMSHDIVSEFKEYDFISTLYELEAAYQPIAATYNREQSGAERARELIGVLTESTYIPVPGEKLGASAAGHPWDNYNEMFASTLTVMRFHTDGFLRRFASLNAPEKAVVASFVQAAYNALYKLKSFDLEEDLNALLPETDLIRRSLGIRAA